MPDALYYAVRPMLAVSAGRMVALSTPFGKRGWFYEAWANGGPAWERIHLPAERCYERWEDLIAAGQLAPALVCCTMDQLHVAPAVAALEAGYAVLLEKPIALQGLSPVAGHRVQELELLVREPRRLAGDDCVVGADIYDEVAD